MILHWPQITMIVLFALSAGVALATNGQPKVTSFWTTAIAVVLELWILYCGGFFGTVE